VKDLFDAFMDNPRCLPPDVLKQVKNLPKGWDEKTWHARCVADYIASMTDRMAILEHQELFDISQVIR
jgi:dGTPase